MELLSNMKNREYGQEIHVPQPQTADKPVAPQGRATQQSRVTRKTNKAKHQLSLPHHNGCKTSTGQKVTHNKA